MVVSRYCCCYYYLHKKEKSSSSVRRRIGAVLIAVSLIINALVSCNGWLIDVDSRAVTAQSQLSACHWPACMTALIIVIFIIKASIADVVATVVVEDADVDTAAAVAADVVVVHVNTVDNV